VTITETFHDNGRSFRTSRERHISMTQALNIHDPFINASLKGLANGPRFERGEKYGPEWREYFYGRKTARSRCPTM